MAKERLDILLTEKGFYPSREKAKAAIMSGIVYADGMIADKAGTHYNRDVRIELKGVSCPYVSRGGLKLEKGLSIFDLNIEGLTCMDIGASTGGFTDCMLQKGAKKVYSVDVGYGQLDWKLRNNPKVVNMERTNIRYLDCEKVEDIEFASVDVSFISLKHVFPVLSNLLVGGSSALALIKPQFEAGRDLVNKGGGVISKAKVHEDVISNCAIYAKKNGLQAQNLSYSPITGPKGNIEYLIHLVKNEDLDIEIDTYIDKLKDVIIATVAEAHAKLRRKK